MKRGISPVIATVILVAIVIVSATIVFMWMRGFVQEKGTKEGKNVELVCEDILFDAGYAEGTLSIVNRGNIPIYSLKIKIFGEGSYETKDIRDISVNWPATGLGQGQSSLVNIQSLVSGKEKILITPVLLGASRRGQKTYNCEDQYGKEIIL